MAYLAGRRVAVEHDRRFDGILSVLESDAGRQSEGHRLNVKQRLGELLP